MFVCLFVGLPTRFSVPCGTETESPRSSSASRSRSGPKEGEATLMSLESSGKEDHWDKKVSDARMTRKCYCVCRHN